MLVSAALAVVTLTGTATLPDRLPARDARRHRVRARRARAAVADVRDGRPARAAERGRTQLRPPQRVARHRPGARRDHHRRRRRRPLLRRQHDQLPRRPRSAARDARRTSSIPVAADRTVTLLGGTREGLAFAWHDRQVRVVLLVMTCVGLVGFNFNTLVPLLASDTLHVDARAFGLLSAAFGLGAFAGAIVTASLQAGDVPRASSSGRSGSASSSSRSHPCTTHASRACSSSASAPRSRSSSRTRTRSSSSPRRTTSAAGSWRSISSRSSASRRSARSSPASLVEIGGTRLAFVVSGSVGLAATAFAVAGRSQRPARPSNEGAPADAEPADIEGARRRQGGTG